MRFELSKCKENKKIMEEDILTTDYDENENPAAYATNELTVRRSIEDSKVLLRFL